MNGTKDNINELVSVIEQQGYSYILGIIKSDPQNKDSDELEIFCNTNDDCINKLLKILKDYKKTRDAKKVEPKQ